jgi:hypothetical protein
MKAVEILRAFLDIIDQAEQPEVTIVNTNMGSDAIGIDDATSPDRRMNQIKDLVGDDDCGCGDYANTPQEKYADLEAVTTDAGGGMQAPKEPEDIRGEHGSLFRDYLARAERGE